MSGWVEATVGISAVALWAVLGMDIVWAALLVFGVLVLIGLRWGPPSSFSHNLMVYRPRPRKARRKG